MVSVVGPRRVSWFVGFLVAVASLWSLAANVQLARSDTGVTGFQTTTTYTGRFVFDYSFEQDYHGAAGPVQFGDSEKDVYTWSEVDRDLIEPMSHTKYKETTYRDVVANGTRIINRIDTAAGATDPGSATCTIHDDGGGEQLVTQQVLTGVPAINPLTTVHWQVPTDVGVGPPNRIREIGSGIGSLSGASNPCHNDDGSSFLGFELACNVCVNYIAPTGNRTAYAKAWMGNATVHLRTLIPAFSKTFHAEQVWSKTTPPNANIISELEQGYAQIDSRVTASFEQITMTTYGSLPKPPPKDCTKLPAQLFNDYVDVLSGTGQPASPPLSRRDKVLLPLDPTCKGTVKLDVSGTVVPSSNGHQRAGPGAGAAGKPSAILLSSSGTVHTRASWGSPTVTLNPTSAGRRLLSGHHTAIAITITLRIAPLGARAWTVTQHGTIPANP